MKAITLHQPFASLIADGTKTIETRSWKPPKAIIGERIAIHAGARRSCDVLEAIGDFHPVGALVGIEGLAGRPGHTIRVNDTDRPWKTLADYPLGAVVATAVIGSIGRVNPWHEAPPGFVCVDVLTADAAGFGTAKADEYGDFSPGRWLWFLEDVEPIDPPILAKGRQGFWNWHDPR